MTSLGQAIGSITDELHAALAAVDNGQLAHLIDVLASTDVWFCGGQGRSGLVARMTAMRLMHLGRTAHVISDTTTPAITSGNGALIISSSGRTPISVAHAQTAHDHHAIVAVLTSSADNPLTAIADVAVTVPATSSRQFGGSLFEQTSLIMLDAVMVILEDRGTQTRAAMHARHANLE